MKGSRGSGAGISLSATELIFTLPGATRPSVTRLTLAPPSENGAWPALASALKELGVASASGGELSVALLHPLIDTRRLTFPPGKLSTDELAGLVSRTAGKYFVGARGTQSVGLLPTESGRETGQVAMVAAAIPTRFLNGLHAAARDAGCSFASVTPAEAAWAAAAVALWPTFGRKTAFLLILEDRRTTLVEMRSGEAANVRRFRAGDADADLIAKAIQGPLNEGDLPQVGSFGMAVGQQDLFRALAPRGVSVSAVPGDWAELAESPEIMAAAFAGSSAGPLLLSDSARARRAAQLRKLMYAVAAAAVVLVGGAAYLELWGAQKKLDAVVAERKALAPQVTETVIGQTSVEEAYNQAIALAEAERRSANWSPVIAELTSRLPEDAYFTAVHTKGDSLTIDGMAVRAARVFDALDMSRTVTGVRAPGQVRHQTPDDGETMERFTISAVRRDTLTKLAPTAPAAGAAGAATGNKPQAPKPVVGGGKAQ